MCVRNGFECSERETCSALCEAAEEWADVDYGAQMEIPMPTYVLESASSNNTPLRHNVVRFGRLYEIDLDTLTEKQREAIYEIFFHPSGIRQSFGVVAKRLNIRKNAVYCRYLGAMRRLSIGLDVTPDVNDIVDDEE